MTKNVSHDQNFKNLILDYPQQALEFLVPDEAPAHFSPQRLAIYCLNLSEHFKTHRVVPVVIFLREADSETMEFRLYTECFEYFTFRYQVCRLKSIPFELWQNSDNLVARLNLPNMRHTADQNILVYQKAVQGLKTLEPDGNKQVKYLDFIDIYSELTDNEMQQWQQQYPEERTTMTRFAERFREEGERTVLERQLQRWFGPLSPDITEKLNKASTVELETWVDNGRDAETLDDVFTPKR